MRRPTRAAKENRQQRRAGVSTKLDGEITMKDGRVEQSNFDTYQMIRMNEAPAIEVYTVKSAEPAGGMGETGTSAVVPAIGNAILQQRGNVCARCQLIRMC